MVERSDETLSQPLPREWLPVSQPPDDAQIWATRTAWIMAAADAELARSRAHAAQLEAAWWRALAAWWRPALACAAAAMLLLFAVERPARPADGARSSIPLALIATAADPVALWTAVGGSDPVLAAIALQGMDGTANPSTADEVNR